MTPEQLKHFLNDGLFNAVYAPLATENLYDEAKERVDDKVIVHRNYEITPCIDKLFEGDYRFFILRCFSVGWIPERDLKHLKIIENEFVADLDRWNSIHQYKMMIRSRKKAFETFGNYGKDCKLPVITFREYAKRRDAYVKSLCKDGYDGVWYREYPTKKWNKI